MRKVLSGKRMYKTDIELIMCVAFFSVGHFSRMLEMFGIPRAAVYSVYICLNFVYVLTTIKKIKLIDILYYLIAIPVVAIGLLKNHSYIDSLSSLGVIVIVFLPSFYLFRSVSFDALFKGFKTSMYFASMYLAIYYITIVRHAGTYDMNYAYWIAPPICFYAYMFLKEKKPSQLLIAVLFFGTLVVSGCRGALGLTIACVGYLYLFVTNMNRSARGKRIAFAIVIALLVLINLDSILLALGQYSDLSRNIRKLLNGNFLESKGRAEIYAVCKQYIDANVWGYGCLSSRKLLFGYRYPHSIIYELQLDFGKYLGGAVFAVIFAAAIYTLWRMRATQAGVCFSIIVVVGFGSLFVSSSLYYEYTVPAVLAVSSRLLLDKSVMRERKLRQAKMVIRQYGQ